MTTYKAILIRNERGKHPVITPCPVTDKKYYAIMKYVMECCDNPTCDNPEDLVNKGKVCETCGKECVNCKVREVML